MKRFHALIFAFILLAHLCAAPADNIAANAKVRQNAIALLRQGKIAESKQLLSTTLPSTGLAGSKDMDVGQQWVRIAFHLHARGESALARQAANEAVASANMFSHETRFDAQRSSLFCNVGLVCDRVLHDPALTKFFYDGAVVAEPSNEQAEQRQKVTEAKFKQRSLGKGPGG